MKQTVKNQHYIPRSYLKNFGFLVNAKKKKWSIYTTENGGQIKRRTTEKVCSVDYLYDLPFIDGDGRQFLEHTYEEHIDRNFPKITAFCTDEANMQATDEMREMIIKSCLALYYRTPKFVDLDNKALEEIKKLPEKEQEEAWKIKKTYLLEKHVSDFEALYNEKKNCGICVNKTGGKFEFVSSDNPVIIRDHRNDYIDVLGPLNQIHIPLTPYYSISIMPSSATDLYGEFQRMYWDDDFVMALNYDMEKNHEKYLLGSEKSLNAYLNGSIVYKKPAELFPEKVNEMFQREMAMKLLYQMIANGEDFYGHRFKSVFYTFWKSIESFRNDKNMEDLKRKMEGE